MHDNPVVDLGGDQSLPVNGSLQLDAGAGFSSYLWYDNDNKQLKTFSGAILGMGQHEVYVSVVDENICKGSDTITISVTAAVGVEEAGDQQIKMYPVPVQEHLTIEIPEAMLGTLVRIYSSSGRILSERNLENQISVFDMSPYSSGYYMITFINQEQVYTKTVVLSR
ncbi:MAG: T9SS type A sorting domain-containing protein [Bacteroidales bacterium]|nr:T9SS type A sorting domain-containing protein [Bacteroidales bacterium]